MAIIKRRGRRSNEFVDRKFFRQNKYHANSEQASPWKIFSMLIFLAILVILLLKNDEPEGNEKLNKREIPDPEKPIPSSSSQLYKFKHAAISSDSQSCSDISRNLLKEQQGNIFDSAISSLICNSLTNIQSTGLFGGFLLTAHLPSQQKSIIIDAQMVAPKNFHMPKNDENFEMIKYGRFAVAVPGFLPGIWEMHKKYSKLKFSDILEPIIDLCKNGVTLTKHLRDSIDFNRRIMDDSYLRELFIDKGTSKIKRIGSRVTMFKQCRFLELLSSTNVSESSIFNGQIGEIIENDLKFAGSLITLDDLKSYKVDIYEAKTIDLNEEYSILVPKTVSLLVPSILKILLKFNFNESSWHINNTVVTHHRIAEAFKYAFAMRSNFGDPNFMDISNITDYMLSDEFANKIFNSINDSHVHEDVSSYGLKDVVPQNHGTSHISIATQNRDTLSVTSSINYYFGAGISGNESGLVFNNGMDDFSYPGRSINYFGLQETVTNYPEPGKRALSSISPIIVIDKVNKQPKMIIGAAGGSKIISALSLSILRYICCTNNLKEIIDAPRFHHQVLPNVLEYEYGIVSAIIEGLMAKGHVTFRYRNRGTIINALSLDERHIYAISDYRKDLSGVAGF